MSVKFWSWLNLLGTRPPDLNGYKSVLEESTIFEDKKQEIL